MYAESSACVNDLTLCGNRWGVQPEASLDDFIAINFEALLKENQLKNVVVFFSLKGVG